MKEIPQPQCRYIREECFGGCVPPVENRRKKNPPRNGRTRAAGTESERNSLLLCLLALLLTDGN